MLQTACLAYLLHSLTTVNMYKAKTKQKRPIWSLRLLCFSVIVHYKSFENIRFFWAQTYHKQNHSFRLHINVTNCISWTSFALDCLTTKCTKASDLVSAPIVFLHCGFWDLCVHHKGYLPSARWSYCITAAWSSSSTSLSNRITLLKGITESSSP